MTNDPNTIDFWIDLYYTALWAGACIAWASVGLVFGAVWALKKSLCAKRPTFRCKSGGFFDTGSKENNNEE